MPVRRKTTASGMDNITIGNARTAKMDRLKISLPRNIKREMAYPAGAAIKMDRVKVIVATMTLLRSPGSIPLEFRKNSIVSKEKGIKGKMPLG